MQNQVKIADLFQLYPLENAPSHLEKELILSHLLQVPRSYLRTHHDEKLSPTIIQTYQKCLTALSKGFPLAYLFGTKEFWSLEFIVNRHTLVPRPETELLVEQTLNLLPEDKRSIIDLGTGCGAVAMAIASEKPKWEIVAADISFSALKIAKQNLLKHGLSNVYLLNSFWGSSLLCNTFDAVISNPPYLSSKDPHLERLKFEPQKALISGGDGLQAIRQIIKEAPNCLKKGGWLLLEHGFDQAVVVRNLMQVAGYASIQSVVDLNAIPRVTFGRWL